jgi:ParB-like chromosome segregation protein Spo0J
MEFHPLANDYPLMSEEELAVLIEDMRQRGFDERFPIVVHEGKVLAGRDRWRAAQAAGVPVTYSPLRLGEDPVALVRRDNEQRKHFPPEVLRALRQARIEREGAARRDGQSLRAIAESEGISETQVRRDLDTAATAPGGAVEPEDGKVTGRDGKQRPARRAGKDTGADSQKPGSTHFGDRRIEAIFGTLSRLFKQRATVYGKSPEYADCLEKLEALIAVWRHWQRASVAVCPSSSDQAA